MKTIIVTGGSGFIGSNFILKNIKKYKIINVDKLTYASNINYLKDISDNKNYFFYKLDINETKKISLIIRKYKPTFLFNFAAESHVDKSIVNSDKFLISNILGTNSLLKAVLKNKSYLKKNFKFIQISTDEVFGDIKRNIKTKESDTYNPSSPYASSKAAADHLVTSWARTYNFNYNITYSSNNFGPNQNKEKFIPVIVDSLIKNKKIPIYGNGYQRRNWIFVEDNVEAIMTIAELGKNNNAYNIGSNNSFSNLDLVNKICHVLIKNFNLNSRIFKLVKFVKDRPGHDKNYNLNLSKIKLLNWKCNYSFKSAIKKTLEWYLPKK